ncbi:NYN domain-containing protein [Corynebacterium argentoratense]|nr:NYN domain-containing protein [Corynebacterium argentoratense]MCF1766148.1 NYN domain-containing protein [Corynebacterium argentoratense]
MLERTQVYVDTSYLLASFYNSWATGARAQLKIDLPEVVAVLGKMVEDQLHQPVQRQYWYDGIPDSGPHRHQRALRTCDGVQLRAGQLIEWGERRTQKAVDTRLVADLVIAGLGRHCSDIVLVSGDADMIPGVEEATAAGLRVHLYGFGWDSMSSALRHACDTTTILDPREDFADCMRIEPLEGPLPAGPVDDNDDSNPQTQEDATEAVPTNSAPVPHDAEKPADGHTTATDLAPTVPTGVMNLGPTVAAEEVDYSESRFTLSAEVSAGQAGQQISIQESAQRADVRVRQKGTTSAANSGSDPATPLTVNQPPAELPTESGTDDQQTAANEEHTPAATAETPAEQKEERDIEQKLEQEDTQDNTPGAPKPTPLVMAPHRKLRSRYVPLPNEVWSSAGFQTPFDVGQQYAIWWYDNAATTEQRDSAHLLSGGGLPPEVDRPLLQFACETLYEYTLSESQRVALRDGFHSGIRAVLLNIQRGTR